MEEVNRVDNVGRRWLRSCGEMVWEDDEVR